MNTNPAEAALKSGMAERLAMLVPVLTGIYIFFNPFPHTTSIKETVFYLAVAIALGLWVFRKRPLIVDTPLTRALLLFIVWVVVTIPFAIDKANTVHDIYSHLLRYLLLYIMIITYFETPRKLDRLVWLVVISSAIFMCGVLYYYYGLLDNDLARRLATSKRAAGLMQTPIHVIGFIALAGSVFCLHYLSEPVSRMIKGCSFLCLLIFVSALFLTQSRGIILGFIVSAGLFFLLKNRKMMLAVVGLLVLLVFFTPVRNRLSPEEIVENVRIRIYWTMAEIIKDYPVTGIGYGMASYAKLDADAYDRKITDPAKKYKRGRGRRLFIADPHNWAIDLLVRTGPVGLILYLNVIVAFFRMAMPLARTWNRSETKTWSICASSCFIGFLSAGLFVPTFTHMVEVLQYLILGIVTVAWRRHGQAMPDPSKTPGDRAA
ncbi:MAG: O-antigen ligase family protein [Thermodesulfobacteriota bacterium]